jgi:circadian clock protein KaiC
MLKAIREFDPQSVIIDPISNLVRAGGESEAHAMVVRLIDSLKTSAITTILTHPTADVAMVGHTELAISSIIDTWILVQTLQTGGERNRTLYILKSRGMSHSNQVREFLITESGIRLVDVYTGPEGVLTGSARASREAEEHAAQRIRLQTIERERRKMARRRKAVQAQIASLNAELEADDSEARQLIDAAEAEEKLREVERAAMAERRRADSDGRP